MTDDNIIIIIVVIIADWYSPALSLPCHHPPWAFFKFVLGERGARGEGKQILIFSGWPTRGEHLTPQRSVKWRGGSLFGGSGLR